MVKQSGSGRGKRGGKAAPAAKRPTRARTSPRERTRRPPGDEEEAMCEIVDEELTALTHPAAGTGLVAAPGAPEVAHALERTRGLGPRGRSVKR